MGSNISINILGIETSCDETAAAVVCNGCLVRSNIIASQIAVHQPYGGVVPEIASRQHLEAIIPVVEQALAAAGCSFEEIDAIAVTEGPGLVGALLVGVSYAKALALAINKPLLGVHHWQGHLAAVFLEHSPEYPFLALLVSGSHSGLVEVKSDSSSRLLGQSLDDAAGEAFDKIARALGLGYPGGPALEQAAEGGNKDYYAFPRAWLSEGSWDFSFSGLKSAVLNYLNRRKMLGNPCQKEEICHLAASAQEAIVEVLAVKAAAAAKTLGYNTIVVAGGVAANQRLRRLLLERGPDLAILWPSQIYCTDNAAMIAAAAYSRFCRGERDDLGLNANPRLGFYKA
ncbi:MAG: tRNA (adenosine(37)-N6)-threonylcarbamoyltransferase complex transferase subunit TsaD [Clostridiales bacterium]|nr:tRNA (adenosine(37)-N6)-threonylcarbamoyltransferase complex transferase subunit TsaD [Clostridiales bacterium]